jgi:hypothetical protein
MFLPSLSKFTEVQCKTRINQEKFYVTLFDSTIKNVNAVLIHVYINNYVIELITLLWYYITFTFAIKTVKKRNVQN